MEILTMFLVCLISLAQGAIDSTPNGNAQPGVAKPFVSKWNFDKHQNNGQNEYFGAVMDLGSGDVYGPKPGMQQGQPEEESHGFAGFPGDDDEDSNSLVPDRGSGLYPDHVGLGQRTFTTGSLEGDDGFSNWVGSSGDYPNADISSSSNPLFPTAAPPPGCMPHQWMCASGLQCVLTLEVCDTRPDCPDGSDEQLCVTPALPGDTVDIFDVDFAGWTAEGGQIVTEEAIPTTSGLNQWTPLPGVNPSPSTAPPPLGPSPTPSSQPPPFLSTTTSTSSSVRWTTPRSPSPGPLASSTTPGALPSSSAKTPSTKSSSSSNVSTTTPSTLVTKPTGDATMEPWLKPGILAAVIAGAVVGLLAAILLVMFIVYRMRKKDEGSYAIDETKTTAYPSYAYHKAQPQEFYA